MVCARRVSAYVCVCGNYFESQRFAEECCSVGLDEFARGVFGRFSERFWQNFGAGGVYDYDVVEKLVLPSWSRKGKRVELGQLVKLMVTYKDELSAGKRWK